MFVVESQFFYFIYFILSNSKMFFLKVLKFYFIFLDKPTDESLFRPDPSISHTVPNKPVKRYFHHIYLLNISTCFPNRLNPTKYSNSFKNKTTKKQNRQVSSYSSSSSEGAIFKFV